MLSVSERQFRRQCRRYESDGLEGLIDLRLGQVSARRAPVDEVLRLVDQYRARYTGWTVKHFYSKYREQKQPRSYNFVRLALQQARALLRFREDYPQAKAHLLHLGNRRWHDRGIEVLPFLDCVASLDQWL